MERTDTQRNLRSRITAIAWLAAVFLTAAGVGCGGDGSDEAPTVNVELFGWAPSGQSGGSGGFVRNLNVYPNAQIMSIKLTQPREQRILSQDTFPITDSSAQLPELSFGENLRLDFDLVKQDPSGRGVRIASGATPIFSSEPGGSGIDYRVMVVPTRDFAPVGARFTTNAQTGAWEYQPVEFDNRTDPNTYFGRTGHRAAPLSNGNVITVGGTPREPNETPMGPSLKGVHGDVQVFDPASGYISDLAFSEQSQQVRPNGAGALTVPRAYHTLTPIGDDRYLVVGGLTIQGEETTPTNSIELIDMSAAEGARVSQLIGANGNPLTLNQARSMHTATYRPEDDTVVVVGGVAGDGKATGTIEVVDIANRQVRQAGEMPTARANHEAILMNTDAGEVIWVLGGWSDLEGVLPTTTLLEPQGTTYRTPNGPLMSRGRYDMAATKISAGGGKIVVVCGGFTSRSDDAQYGAPTDHCELGRPDFEFTSPWSMTTARGGADLMELGQSDDLVIIGGRDANGDTVSEVSKMVFEGQSANPPYRMKGGMGTMWKARYNATVNRLDNGMILLTGGVGPVNNTVAGLKTLEYYNPEDIVSAQSASGNGSGGGSTSGGTSGGSTSGAGTGVGTTAGTTGGSTGGSTSTSGTSTTASGM